MKLDFFSCISSTPPVLKMRAYQEILVVLTLRQAQIGFWPWLLWTHDSANDDTTQNWVLMLSPDPMELEVWQAREGTQSQFAVSGIVRINWGREGSWGCASFCGHGGLFYRASLASCTTWESWFCIPHVLCDRGTRVRRATTSEENTLMFMIQDKSRTGNRCCHMLRSSGTMALQFCTEPMVAMTSGSHAMALGVKVFHGRAPRQNMQESNVLPPCNFLRDQLPTSQM